MTPVLSLVQGYKRPPSQLMGCLGLLFCFYQATPRRLIVKFLSRQGYVSCFLLNEIVIKRKGCATKNTKIPVSKHLDTKIPVSQVNDFTQ